MANKLNKVVIFGGGTAGWMTAAYLKKAFSDNINVTVVESAAISTVGVGEATFSTIRLFFDFLELEESDWMPECNGSYKLAIKFIDWNAEKRAFFHPFQRYEMVDGFSVAEWWLKLKSGLDHFDYSCFTIPTMCDQKRSPRFLNGDVFDTKVESLYKRDRKFLKQSLADLKVQFPYAYHFNAGLLAKFLCKYAVKKGVNHIDDEVVDVTQHEDGRIRALVGKKTGEIDGDLFVDCTGFRGLLINKVLQEKFNYFSESLFCDSALATQIPKDIDQHGINPYTSATALTSGWVWNIPLYGRDGTGYVYSSSFTSAEKAEEEFRKHLGAPSDTCKFSQIKMRIGRNQNSWVKNCVAIGLSSGFVEPLESTGIFFIQQAIEELVKAFPHKELSQDLISTYNKNIADCIDGVKDFLTLHYYASTRMDSDFWKATKHDLKVPEELKERMKIWKTILPNANSINRNYHGFEAYSYSVMLMGLGYLPSANVPVLDYMNDTNAVKTFNMIKRRAEVLCATLPSQYEYLTSVNLFAKSLTV
jgi:flavin-dependent dehydrogenase